MIVGAPALPLYQLGFLAGKPRLPLTHPRFTHTVEKPPLPLYQQGFLGQIPGRIVAATGPVAGAITGAAIASAGAGTAWGSFAGPIGAGVGALIGLIGGLLAAHELRAKQARDENSAMNLGISGFDDDLKKVQQAFNSGQIDASGATQAVETLYQNYWNLVTPHIQPGRNGCAGGCPAIPVPANYCSGNIGAACCVGCESLNPSMNGPNGVLAAIQGASGSKGGANTAEIWQVFGSKYGGRSRASYQLTFKASSSLTAALTSPGAGVGGSFLPLLLIAGAAFAFLR